MRLTYTGAPQEEDLRSAVSRAYYSLYHETFGVLKREYPDELAESVLVELKKRQECDPKITIDEEKIKALDDKYIAESKVSMHARIRDTLRRIGIGKLRRVYDSVNACRNAADYDFTVDFDQEDVKAKLLRVWNATYEVKALKNPSRVSA
jgi:hypothetical protein